MRFSLAGAFTFGAFAADVDIAVPAVTPSDLRRVKPVLGTAYEMYCESLKGRRK